MPTYSYTFALYDKISNPMQRIAASGNSAYDKLTGKQKKYNAAVDAGNKKVGIFSNGVGKLKAAVGGLIGLQMGRTMLRWASDMEQTQVSFQTLTGSVERGNKLFNQINQFANITPFNNADLMQSAKTMLNFGINVEKVMPSLKMLGDVSGGNAERLKSLTLAFSQVSSQGKLMGQDLLQFINAGFNPLMILSQQTGKSMSQLKDEMSKGQITAEMVAQAFKIATSEGGMFYNMMEKQSNTLGGKWSTFMGKLQNSLASLMLSQNDVFAKVMDKLIAGVDWFTNNLPKIQTWISRIVGVLGKAYSIIKANAETIKFLGVVIGSAVLAYKAWNIAMRAGMAIMGIYKATVFTIAAFTRGWAVAQRALNIAMLSNPIGLIIAGIAALAAGIIWAWNKFEGFRGAILGTWEVLKGFGDIIKSFVIDRIKGLISGLGSIAQAFKELFQGNWGAAWDAAKSGVSSLAGTDAVRNALQAGAQLGQKFRAGFEKGKSLGTIKMPSAITGVMRGTGTVTASDSIPVGDNLSTSTEVQSGISGITGGGIRNNNISINLDSLINTFTINSETIEGVERMRDIVTEQLLRVLNSSNRLSTQQ